MTFNTAHSLDGLSHSNESKSLLTDPTTRRLNSHAKFPTELEGYIFILVSTLVYSISEVFIHLSENKLLYAVAPTLFIRGLVQTIFSFTFFFFSKHARENLAALTRHQQSFVALLSFSFTGGYICLLYGLRLLPLADCVSLLSTYPIITTFLAVFFLHESITRLDVVALFVTTCGVLLVTGTRFGESTVSHISIFDRLIGSLFSLLSGFLFSVGYVTTRYLGERVHYMVPVLCYGACMLISAPVLNKGVHFVLFTNAWGAFVATLAALSSIVAMLTLTVGFQKCPAAYGSIILVLEVPFSFLTGVWFLGEKSNIVRVSGSIMIVCSALAVGVRQALLIRSRSEQLSLDMKEQVV